jgi:hypothetical protein
MNVFQRSFEIAKLSFGAIKKDKEMLLFPLLSGIFSVLFFVAMLFPTIILALIEDSSSVASWEVLEYVLLFVTYLGLAVIATFFNVCVVYTAKERFEGRDPTFFPTIKFAFSKFHLIFLWGILSATVGVILALIKRASESSDSVAGRVVGSVVHKGASLAWNIVTIFIVPAMVYYDLTPFKAIKKSTETLKKTWGESIVKHFGMGIVKFLVYLLLIIAIGVGLYFAITLGASTTIILVIVVASLFILALTVLIFSCANQVFDTALFVYADKGQVPDGWNKEVLAKSIQ